LSDKAGSYPEQLSGSIGPDRQSLLVADDVGDVIWRVGPR
jgi:hypothetical protein